MVVDVGHDGAMTSTRRRGPGRPSGSTHVVDREALLDAAERVLARDGSGASLEAIAEEAGVTKPSGYLRGGSRAELSNALANRLAERLVVAARPAVTGARLDRDMLAAFCTITLRTRTKNAPKKPSASSSDWALVSSGLRQK